MSSSSNTPATIALRKLDLASAHIVSLYRDRKPVFAALVAGLLGTLAVARAAWQDYRLFLSYGPGGIPHNILGWFISGVVLRPLRINVFDTGKFEKDEDKRSWLGDEWPKKIRAGTRPRVGPHPIPQRQLDQYGSGEMKEVSHVSSLPHGCRGNIWDG